MSPPWAEYLNPRLPDPCPHLGTLSLLTFPDAAHLELVRQCLSALANVLEIVWLPLFTVVELVTDDGRVYAPRSLPARVAGRSCVYTHLRERWVYQIVPRFQRRAFKL